MPNPNTIVLDALSLATYDEGRAAGTITPGMLLGKDGNNKLIAHPTAGGPAAKHFAVENDFLGSPDDAVTIDTNYVADDLVRYHRALPGDKIYALIVAGGTAVDEDDYLTSAGDGTLKVATSTDVRIARPVEPVDNSAGGTPMRCRVEII